MAGVSDVSLLCTVSTVFRLVRCNFVIAHFALFILFESCPANAEVRVYQSSDKFYSARRPKTPNTLFNYYFNTSASATKATPCTFPIPQDVKSWLQCNIESETARKYNICDPQSVADFSKTVDPLRDLVEKIQKQHADQCVCDNTSGPRCWYKFAFAFLKEFKFPNAPLPPDISDDELCNPNKTSDQMQPLKPIPFTTREMIMDYGNKFAEILRKRWSAGSCEEDILILVVKRSPPSLWNGIAKPLFFVSFGETVKSRTEHIKNPQHTHIKSMIEAVEVANEMMQGSGENATMGKALVILVQWYDQLLTLADQTYHRYNPRGRGAFKSHIPPTWALGAFAGCALLLVIMGVGSCLVRTRVRRGGSRGKTGNDPNRRWKAGFVGEQPPKSPQLTATAKPVTKQETHTKVLFPLILPSKRVQIKTISESSSSHSFALPTLA